jgi:hypothetical protein
MWFFIAKLRGGDLNWEKWDSVRSHQRNPIVGFDQEGGGGVVMVSGFENGGWCFLEKDAPL